MYGIEGVKKNNHCEEGTQVLEHGILLKVSACYFIYTKLQGPNPFAGERGGGCGDRDEEGGRPHSQGHRGGAHLQL